MPDALASQLQNIANYLCDCRQSRLAPASVDPEAHDPFCAFRVANQAVDVRAENRPRVSPQESAALIEQARREVTAVRGIVAAAYELCVHGVPLSDPCPDCLQVSSINEGVPSDPDATVLTECSLCPAVIETRTGCRGVDDALSAGWDFTWGMDLICPSCAEARADLIGEEG